MFLIKRKRNESNIFLKRENLQSGPGVKKAFYATNDVLPGHISIDLTIHSCTHKYNSIKYKILKHLSDLRSSNASHLLLSSYHRTSTSALEPPHTSVKSCRTGFSSRYHKFNGILGPTSFSFSPIFFETWVCDFKLKRESLRLF